MLGGYAAVLYGRAYAEQDAAYAFAAQRACASTPLACPGPRPVPSLPWGPSLLLPPQYVTQYGVPDASNVYR